MSDVTGTQDDSQRSNFEATHDKIFANLDKRFNGLNERFNGLYAKLAVTIDKLTEWLARHPKVAKRDADRQ